jgi:hypothetical protein
MNGNQREQTMPNIFEQAGIASFLPGMRYSIELLVREVVTMKQRAGIPTADLKTTTEQVLNVLLGQTPEHASRRTLPEPMAIEQRPVVPELPAGAANSKRWTKAMRKAQGERMREYRRSGLIGGKKKAEPPEITLKAMPAAKPKAERPEPTERIGGLWTTAGLAKRYGVSPSTIQRIVNENGLKPQLAKDPNRQKPGGKLTSVWNEAMAARIEKKLPNKLPLSNRVKNHPAHNPAKRDEWVRKVTAHLKKQPEKRPRQRAPEMVGDRYTWLGAMKYLGYTSVDALRSRIKRMKTKGERVLIPGTNKKILVYTQAELERTGNETVSGNPKRQRVNGVEVHA